MNNEIAPILDILEELKQDCKSISKAQAELRTTLAEQPANSIAPRTTYNARNRTNSSFQRDASQNQGAPTFCFGGTLAVEQETRPEV